MEISLLKEIAKDQREVLQATEPGVEREKLAELEKLPRKNFAVVITGPRRCGKSTLLRQFVEKHAKSNYYYFDFDDERIASFQTSDFEHLLTALYELYGEKEYFLFDEIQNIDKWELFINRLLKTGKKIVITGSNSKMLSGELATHLTGRHLDLELFPFSFKEYLKAKNFTINAQNIYTTKERAAINKYLNEYIEFGGFPEMLNEKNYVVLQKLFEDIIYKDTRNLSEKQFSVKEAANFLITNVANKISLYNIKNQFEMGSVNTAKKLIEALEKSYLLFTASIYSSSYKQQLVNPKKIYCVDTGLANNVSIKLSKNHGQLLENLVFTELRRKNNEMYYFQKKQEVDFILVEKNKAVQAIQVSSEINKDSREREEKALLEALQETGLEKGLIITREHEEVKKGNGKIIQYIPIWKWLLQ